MDGIIFNSMYRSRALFKYSLRYCKRIENRIVADKLAEDLCKKDYVKFWKHVNTINVKRAPVANSVGGCSGSEAIAYMWQKHFSNVLNNTSNRDLCRVNVLDILKDGNVEYTNSLRIDVHEIQESINALRSGVACGPDNVSAEHFKYAGRRLSVLLSMFLTCVFSHGYLPDQLMSTTIIPLLKDKMGDISDVNNYRPIAIATVTSKLIENIILHNYCDCLATSDNQFSYKKEHSTDMAIFCLKETVNIYRRYSSPLFVCFLDASKAFDKLNHWALFAKLIERNMPLFIVKLMLFWYSNQSIRVLWHDVRSHTFKTSNGVKQGGILSPLLFNVYMNELSCILNKSGVGCHINNNIVNHIMYADDMCLIAPCATAVQKLLDICYKYASTHDIVYNTKKSVCMLINSNKFNLRTSPTIKLGDTRLSYVSSYKYLGCLITDELSDNGDIKKTLRGIYARANVLIRKFSNCSTRVKKQLFQAFCTNLYCTHLWWSYSKETLLKTTVAYNNSLRFLLGYQRFCSASGMFVECNLDNFATIRRRYIYNFMCRTRTSSNCIIQTLVKHQCYVATPSVMEWGRSLYAGERLEAFQ